MIRTLSNTTTSEISKAIVWSRSQAGSPTQARVLTLIVITDGTNCHDARATVERAAREHPARILLVVCEPESAESGLDATLHIAEGNSQEVIELHLRGEVARHPAPVILALVLPDSPIVAWWPTCAPTTPAADPIGALANRRITDAAGSIDPLAELQLRANHHCPCDTDLSWTRLTLWRALLAAALDQLREPVLSVSVSAAWVNPSAILLVSWLERKLAIPVSRLDTGGPGITEVQMVTAVGEICVSREDASLGVYQVAGQPPRKVALPRRSTDELLSEELRRLDPDEVFAETLAALCAKEPDRG